MKRPAPLSSPCSHANVCMIISDVMRRFAPRMLQQGVDCHLEYDDAELRFPIQDGPLAVAVTRLIEDALSAMPDGGELDVTALVSTNGLEIEVADTRDNHRLAVNDSSVRSSSFLRDARQAASACGGRVESLACPQGGQANTLWVRWPAVRTAA